MSVFEVTRNQRPKSLLSSCIPELQSVVFGFMSDIFGEEVDAYGRLSEVAVTLAV
jgi:hypothetical protein